MATAITKRQQARNERQLQELIHNVAGNDRCADCGVKNPGWASWNLGIFLCVRCASLHRKLGTHVSKIKSLSMDSWSTEQVDNMKKVGNVRSNAAYNPKNVKADIPIDADEVDNAIERFIRAKYESRTLSTNSAAAPAVRQNTGSTGTGSWNEEPPALPPKPKKFFSNLRSASSTFHRPKQDRFTPPLSPAYSGDDRSTADATISPHKSKPSQLFGMKITGVSNNFDQKLAMLKEMGFEDNRRNSEILKRANGNLDEAVDTLSRLGEGSKPAVKVSATAPRTMTPVSMESSGLTGISVEKTRKAEHADPWEIKAASPQRAATQSAPPVSVPQRSQSTEPASNSWNPFIARPQQSQQPPQSLEASFQNMHVSHTGPSQQPSFPQNVPQQQWQNNPFQAQPVQSNPWQPLQIAPQNFAHTQQQQPTQQQAQADQSNPFLRSQNLTSSNPWAVQQGPQPTQSPFGAPQQQNPWSSQTRSPPPLASLFEPPQTAPAPWQQQQQSVFQQTATASPAPMPGQSEYFAQQRQQSFAPASNPWQQQQQPQQPMQQPSYQPFPPQQPVRHDKSSILALYNMPQLAPRRPLQTLPEDPYATPGATQPQFATQQRSATMPIQAKMNPYMTAPPQTLQSTQGIRHVSNESVDFQGMGAGRHSPDAFAGLSAQYMR